MFDYSRRRFANLAFGLFGSTNWNPFMNDLYQSPSRVSGRFVQTLAEMFDGLHSTWSGTVGSRRAANWCHVVGGGCNGGLDNTGYVTQWRADIASLSDLASKVTGTLDGCTVGESTPGGCTWNHAWNWLQTNVHRQHLYHEITKFILVPHAEITGLTCMPAGTSALCTYTAPTENACTYRVSTSAPADTLDTNDTSDGGGVLARTAVFTALNPETLYHLRVTCGQRLSGVSAGTGRTSATFRTLRQETTTNMALSVGAIPGVTGVVVEYGDSSGLGSSLQAVSCANGCAPRIPAMENKLLYYRVTYVNGSGSIVARGAVTPVMPR